MTAIALPTQEGTKHHNIDIGGFSIHVAEAGPPGGPAVMLVHGFPANWWMWHELIGPLAADGYRVLCPDLRGAGWSSAPPDRYLKSDMADDLAVVLGRLGVPSVRLVAHDWGGPVAAILMLRHPEVISGFFGLNTLGPWVIPDLATLRGLWRTLYQYPMSLPVLGPKTLGDPHGRYLRSLSRWVGAGFTPAELDLYIRLLGEPGHAQAGSRWYRTSQSTELIRWMRGEYAGAHVDVPVRFLHGIEDPVVTPLLVRGFAERADDFKLETVPDVGHWIVEQKPDLVLDRLRMFLRETAASP